MSPPMLMSGVLAPVITPFTPDLAPDPARLIRQCRWLLSQNCGLAVFGTNSEANSLAVEEKVELLDALVGAGIDARRMMPGTGACALSDAVRLTAHAVRCGCSGVLMLPPFYYKGVDDAGLYRFFAEVIERVGDARLRIYLYHFPQLSGVPISLTLIEKLLHRYSAAVVGIKDSSGDWNNMLTTLRRFPGFAMFCGTEAVLLKNMQNGGAGCISATANVNPAAIAELASNWRGADAQRRQDELNVLRELVQALPLIPALKAIVARYAGDADWDRVRPPLVELTPGQKAALFDQLEGIGFAMPGLREAA